MLLNAGVSPVLVWWLILICHFPTQQDRKAGAGLNWVHNSVWAFFCVLSAHPSTDVSPVWHLGSILCRAWVLFSEPVSDACRNKTGMSCSSSSKMQVVFYLMFDIVLLCTHSKWKLVFYVTDRNCWCFLFSQVGLATRCVSSSQQLWVSSGWSVVVSKFSTVLNAFKIWLQVGVFPKEYSWIG